MCNEIIYNKTPLTFNVLGEIKRCNCERDDAVGEQYLLTCYPEHKMSRNLNYNVS